MESMYNLLGIHKPSEKTKDNVDKSKKTDHEVLKGRFKIQKSDNDKHLAFGWASIAIDEAGEQLVDWQEDMIDPEDLETLSDMTVQALNHALEQIDEATKKKMGAFAGKLPF